MVLAKTPYGQLLCVGVRCKDIIKAHILDPGVEDNCSARRALHIIGKRGLALLGR
jgi:hypothetical protein